MNQVIGRVSAPIVAVLVVFLYFFVSSTPKESESSPTVSGRIDTGVEGRKCTVPRQERVV